MKKAILFVQGFVETIVAFCPIEVRHMSFASRRLLTQSPNWEIPMNAVHVPSWSEFDQAEQECPKESH
jgi:hypothetical protein